LLSIFIIIDQPYFLHAFKKAISADNEIKHVSSGYLVASADD